jgi:hypothetical protein
MARLRVTARTAESFDFRGIYATFSAECGRTLQQPALHTLTSEEFPPTPAGLQGLLQLWRA